MSEPKLHMNIIFPLPGISKIVTLLGDSKYDDEVAIRAQEQLKKTSQNINFPEYYYHTFAPYISFSSMFPPV